MLSYTRSLRGALRTTCSLWDAGVVKFWPNWNGMRFGFIAPESGGKLFVHRQNIGTPDPPLVRRLTKGAAVTYDVEQREGKPEGKMQAVNVRGEAITDKTPEEWLEQRNKHREEMRAALTDKSHPLHEKACALKEEKARRMANKLRKKKAKEASKLLVGKKKSRQLKLASRKAARAEAYEKMTPEEKAKVDAKRENAKAFFAKAKEKKKQQKESAKKIAA